MEDSSLKQPTMVSRLPKFGSRASSAPGPFTNASAPAVSSGWGKGVPVGKQNGVIRVSPTLSAKAKKEKENDEKAPDLAEEVRTALFPQQQLRPPGTVRQIKKPSAATGGKAQRSIPTASSTFPRTVSQSTKANQRTAATKHPSASQRGANGVAPVRGSSSSDSLRSLPVETVVRSQSFTYLKKPSTLTDPPLTRSFSFNRAAELAKELPRPLAESPVARSPVTQPSIVSGGDRGGPFGVTKPTIAPSTSTLPPAALKKSLLPSCAVPKPSVLGYKLSRPSLVKQPYAARPAKAQEKLEATKKEADAPESVPPIYGTSSNPESFSTTPDDPKEADSNRGPSLEVLEDMSLSSTSSLERNDVSEEYIDDFDDLGTGGILLMGVHGGENGQLGYSEHQERASVSSLHCFAAETVDWRKIGLTGTRKASDGSDHRVTQTLSPGSDLPHGSSLDLSPSDSSGGTYMWDEEVLEPLVGGAQLCRSYDSNLNSMDVLNNLENSCDLEEDDLMLDVDLSEDISLHSDSEFWQWRKRQQFRGRKEKLHNNNGDGMQAYDSCGVQGSSRSASGLESLDELMLKHMAQDCSSVKDQLLQLRRLLQMEDDGSVDEEIISSPSDEEQSYQQHVEELLQEVQRLREELKMKDRIIAKLSQQESTRDVTHCHCQQGKPEISLQRRSLQDRGTQTPWRVQNPQILQPSRAPASGHLKLARPSSRTHFGAPSDHVDAQSGDCPVRPQSWNPVIPVTVPSNAALPSAVPSSAPTATVSATPAILTSSGLNSDELTLLLNNHLRIDDSKNPGMTTGTTDTHSRTDGSDSVRDRAPRENHQPGGVHSLRREGILNKPRGGGAQVSLGRGMLGTSKLQMGFNGPSRTRHLPPPNRGLPCISLASQVIPLAPVAQSQGIAMNSRDAENNSIRTQDLNSRLPKPKSH
ncbi:serine-rich coiled-coil domain-containing protein 2 isoform X2 [Trichomycterus rosablanca]|uniref:serine-rich coiled-coil domain-containing protein 2 isoform X2 n=1 Tax=Trichomycterus rosablanca TaxID=2290929 RepID=UPI002F357013